MQKPVLFFSTQPAQVMQKRRLTHQIGNAPPYSALHPALSRPTAVLLYTPGPILALNCHLQQTNPGLGHVHVQTTQVPVSGNEGIVNLSKTGHCAFVVDNLTAADVHIPEGTYLGFVEPIEEHQYLCHQSTTRLRAGVQATGSIYRKFLHKNMK